jgi:hypothetical protein
MVMVAVNGIVVELVVVMLSVVTGLVELPLLVLNVVIEDVNIL